MTKKILIRDLTLRDGQQSQLATRMTQQQVDRVLPRFRDAGFDAMEVWGGAVPDSVMRYLDENPWDRLASIHEALGDTTRLTALSRGRNLFGYSPYPEDVIEGFNRNAVESGIDIMRIFDALNDIDNMRSTIRYVKENGGEADCAICFTVDPQFTFADRMKALFRGEVLPSNVFGVNYFVEKARELTEAGADIITIKDMAGLVDPAMAAAMTKKIKSELDITLNLHTHSTPGYGLASVLMAMVNGVDMIDTVISPFAGGPAAPPYELLHVFIEKLGFETDVDLDAVADIRRELFTIRKELSEYDQYDTVPHDFHPGRDTLSPKEEALFDTAVAAARKDDTATVLTATRKIEQVFGYPPPNEIVKEAQIPGGMYTNMTSQLKNADMEHKLNTVLKTVPRVRLDSGVPPLVTPTSQIVGIQAVTSVLNLEKNMDFYENTSVQFVRLVRGEYGKTPVPVKPTFREKIAGSSEEQPYDTSQHEKQGNTELEEFGGVKLATTEKEELLLELFPAVAKGFLRKKREQEYRETIIREARKEQDTIDNSQETLIQGLSENYLAGAESLHVE